MRFYRFCNSCSNTEISGIRLSDGRPGQKLSICGINGGRGAGMRLRSMGLQIGDNIEIVSTFGGQVVIAIDNTRLVLCCGLSKKIIGIPV